MLKQIKIIALLTIIHLPLRAAPQALAWGAALSGK